MSGEMIQSRFIMISAHYGVLHILLYMMIFGTPLMLEISVFLIKRGLFNKKYWPLMRKLVVKQLIMQLLIVITLSVGVQLLFLPHRDHFQLLALVVSQTRLHLKMY